jgi:hypothetical protein
MPTQAAVRATLSLMALLGTGAQATGPAAKVQAEPKHVTLTITESKPTDTALTVRFRIVNNSRRDIWICESIFAGISPGPYFEVYLPEGSDTLTIRRRLKIAGRWNQELALPPDASYLRVPAGEERSEGIVLPLPIRPMMIWSDDTIPHPARRATRPQVQTPRDATRLRMQIGFHESDLPQRILEVLSAPQMLTRRNEVVRDRDRVVQFPHDRQFVEQEQMLSAVAEVPRIPCVGESFAAHFHETKPPDVGACTRVEVKYHPSMLEYFFPTAGEQSLLSPEEKAYLALQKTTLVDRREQIALLNNDIGRGEWSVVVTEEARADVVGYRNEELLASFAVFGDERLLTSEGLQFTYAHALTSLRTLAPQIRPYELRV